MRVVVTGVPGVGKTTIMVPAAKMAGREIVTYGTVMFEMAKSEGLVKDRDEMRKLPINTQRDLQKRAAKKIYEMGDVVIDTHCTIKTPNGYWPGLPKHVIENLMPDSIVLIEAEPEEIAKRRAKDATRVRDSDLIESIAEHQQINRYVSMAYAALTGATVMILKNEEGKVEETARKLAEIL